MRSDSSDSDDSAQNLIIVTGLSGAGKSSVLNALEDSGYHVIDNLPIPLVGDLLDRRAASYIPSDLAVGLDIRTRSFTAGDVFSLVESLKDRDDLRLRVLMVDASDDILLRRFSETRRPHPLGRDQSVRDAIAAERAALNPLIEFAEVIDTTALRLADLRPLVLSRFAQHRDNSLTVTVKSFGFAHGVPSDADMVLDVRFLRNPHYDARLRPLTGQHQEVADYVRMDAAYAGFFDKVIDMLEFLLPRYQAEGKIYLTLAFGCTGGKHRSVTVAEAISRALRDRDMRVRVVHRDKPEDA